MNRILVTCLVIGASGISCVNAADKPRPPVWEELAPFSSEEEFEDYLQKYREAAKARGWYYGNSSYGHYPLLAQAEAPCDPSVQECPQDDVMEEVVTTGMRASSVQSITNNQEAGVDEGDIVKAFDRFIVVLQHGRLFSIDTGGAPGSLRLVDRIDAYQSANVDSWIDEVLIYDDTLLVTGYSYETSASVITLFRIDRDGVFTLLSRYFLESEDYYSGDNYATRIVDGQLVIYMPVGLHRLKAGVKLALPRIRRWTPGEAYSEWQPLFGIRDVYRPIQPTLSPAIHVVSSCGIDASRPLACSSTGIVGPWDREMYVAPGAVYLWLSGSRWDQSWQTYSRGCADDVDPLRAPAVPAAVFRLKLVDREVEAIHTVGDPPDQFALEARPREFWALVRRELTDCQVRDEDGDYVDPPYVLARVPQWQFSTRPRTLSASNYLRIPQPDEDSYWTQSRFSEDYLVYGSGKGYRDAFDEEMENRSGRLAVIPLQDPRGARTIDLPHTVGRIELFGRHAVTFGYGRHLDFAVSSIRLGPTARIADTTIIPDAVESEGRSHAFNSLARPNGAGAFGIPTIARSVIDSEADEWPEDVQFVTADSRLRLTYASKLDGKPERSEEETGYTCEVSCVDWYGNARPIFYRGRVFALTGQEFVEGELRAGRIAEIARVNIATTPEHRRAVP